MKQRIFFIPLLVNSQEWCPAGAIWHYGANFIFMSGYHLISYDKDTLINSVPCKRLNKSVFLTKAATSLLRKYENGSEYTYSDLNKVYIFKHNKVYTVYDFSANVGDLWIVPEIRRYTTCDTNGIVKVDSVGTITINGQTLRYIVVSQQDVAQQWDWNFKIIEKIDPVNGYLLPEKLEYCGMHLDEFPEGGKFRCYNDSASFFYTSNIAPFCDYVMSDTEHKELVVTFSVYPNPSQGSFKLNIGNAVFDKITISDLAGNLIATLVSPFHDEIQINNLVLGIYMLSAMRGDKIFVRRKIIITLL